ncbi:MAG: helix-turn-helix domain-containing protein [Desulfovibrionaceae bacterium]|nr:helix-turn-helix domain-containing protein [Desulfovibrionaceae bacterium]
MLHESGGNKRLAASRLGISYNTLWRILENVSEDKT